MLRIFRLSVILVAAGLLQTPVALADEFDLDDETDQPIPKFQIGVGLDYRLDDATYNEYVPSVSVQGYYALKPTLDLRLGILHNSLTRLEANTSYHTVAADVGLRVSFPHELVTPYLESGFWFPYYWGVQWGYDYDDFSAGLRIAGGLSVALSRRVSVDAAVSQILNRLSEEQVYYLDAIPPLGGGTYRPWNDPTGAYNDTKLELGFRIRL